MNYSLKLTCYRMRHFYPVAVDKTVRASYQPSIYIGMKEHLIQGAKPFDQAAHDKYNNFQGGYRCDMVIMSQPAKGTIAIAEDKLGFEFFPPQVGWSGHVAFSYKLVNPFGQESDAKCIHVYVGV